MIGEDPGGTGEDLHEVGSGIVLRRNSSPALDWG